MEWPSKAFSWRPHDFNCFSYEERPSTVVTLRLDNTSDSEDAFSEDSLTSPDEWESWLRDVALDSENDDLATLYLVLFPRTSKTVLECPTEINSLPVSRTIFERITNTLNVHRSLARMINRKDADFLPCLRINQKYEPERLVCNYRTSAALPSDIAVSVTHDPRSRSTTAVFLGLTESQERDLLRRMRDSVDDFCHPLALVGAACEIERDRWICEQVRPIEATYLEKNDYWSTASTLNLASDAEDETMENVLTLRFDSSFLLTTMVAARRQLGRISEYLQNLNRDENMTSFLQGGRNFSEREMRNGNADVCKQQTHTAGRLQHRLNQISDEFDTKIDSCRASMEDMMATTQVVISRLARHDAQLNTTLAVATRRDSSQMRSIAFVTMIYLPLTSIATIFSMNVFNWDAKDGENLLSVYFWLYLIVAGASTALTVGLWIFYTSVRKRLLRKNDEEASCDTKMG